MKVAFLLERLSLRGVEGVAWSYARYNQTLLGNESVIVLRRPANDFQHDVTAEAHDMFHAAFEVHVAASDDDIDPLLERLGVDVCYVPVHGGFDPGHVPRRVPTLAHCVFRTDARLGTVRAAVSNWVSRGLTRVLPNVLDLPGSDGTDLRAELGIPADAFVFGRHGGYDSFDVPWVPPVVLAVAAEKPDVYFVFMHTASFVEPDECPPNVLFVPGTADKARKRRFIDTCDAMLHARQIGETFGCACGEFALAGRPVVTFPGMDQEHVRLLDRLAVTYTSPEQLDAVLRDTDGLRVLRGLRCDYLRYTPDNVMPVFRRAIVETVGVKHGAALPFAY
jgi:hypothetical protein